MSSLEEQYLRSWRPCPVAELPPQRCMRRRAVQRPMASAPAPLVLRSGWRPKSWPNQIYGVHALPLSHFSLRPPLKEASSSAEQQQQRGGCFPELEKRCFSSQAVGVPRLMRGQKHPVACRVGLTAAGARLSCWPSLDRQSWSYFRKCSR
jgi:uncharacterized protein with NAD-binding domain and iron-sulfur cluster